MKLKFILLAIVAFLALQCSTTKDTENQDCESTAEAVVIDVKGQTETEVNKDLILEVFFPVTNGCGLFNKFIETIDGNTITVSVEANYKGCICTMDIPIRIASDTFTPTEAGLYELRFKSSTDTFIEKTITVN